MFIQCCWNIHFCSCFWMFVASLIFLVVPKTALTFLTCKVWRFNPGCLCFLLWQQHPHLDRGSRTGIKKVVGVPAKPDFKDSIALCISLSLCSYSIVQAQRFNAQEAAEWISSRYQASWELMVNFTGWTVTILAGRYGGVWKAEAVIASAVESSETLQTSRRHRYG